MPSYSTKWKTSWILLSISIAGNLLLVYSLINNAITASYAEIDRKRYIRQRTDALEFLNLALETNASFDFSKAKEHFLKKDKNKLYKPYEDGIIVLGELCFKKIGNGYRAPYCNE